jgi:sulfite exporter TauE/SafE
MCLGAGTGGGLSRMTLTGATESQRAALMTASLLLIAFGLVLLFAARQMGKRVGDDVTLLQKEMDAIEAECRLPTDRFDAVEPVLVRPAVRLREE